MFHLIMPGWCCWKKESGNNVKRGEGFDRTGVTADSLLAVQTPGTLILTGNVFQRNRASNSGGGVSVVGAGKSAGNNLTASGNTFNSNQV